MPRQVFTAGEILTAANMNDLSDATVMVFDSSAARGSAIPTPAEGMVTYRKDTNQVSAFNGSAFAPIGTILQVVSTPKLNQFSTTSTSLVDVTDLSVSITPSATSSKVLVTAYLTVRNDLAGNPFDSIQLVRDSTSIFTSTGGTDNGSFVATTANFGGGAVQVPVTLMFLDSPSTTSATTYKIQIKTSAGTVFVGGASDARSASSITVMEVAG